MTIKLIELVQYNNTNFGYNRHESKTILFKIHSIFYIILNYFWILIIDNLGSVYFQFYQNIKHYW